MRARSCKSRDRLYYQSAQSLVSRWRDAMRRHAPMQATHVSISEWIRSLDVTITQRASLMDKHWALRDFCVAEHARWQLYLDGVPRTFDAIAAIATIAKNEALPLGKGPAQDAYAGVMRRICGRHEWDDSHDPFYADDPPGFLNSDSGKA